MSELQDKVRRVIDAQLADIHANREKLVSAWTAETGLKPSESMLVTQRVDDGSQRLWIQRREDLPIEAAAHRAERAAVVRFVRSAGYYGIADAIERGEHLKETP